MTNNHSVPAFVQWRAVLQSWVPVALNYAELTERVCFVLSQHFKTSHAFDLNRVVIESVILSGFSKTDQDIVARYENRNKSKFSSSEDKRMKTASKLIIAKVKRLFVRLKVEMFGTTPPEMTAQITDEDIENTSAAMAVETANPTQLSGLDFTASGAASDAASDAALDAASAAASAAASDAASGNVPTPAASGDASAAPAAPGDASPAPAASGDASAAPAAPGNAPGDAPSAPGNRRFGSRGNNDRTGAATDGSKQDLYETPFSAFKPIQNMLLSLYDAETAFLDPFAGNRLMLEHLDATGFKRLAGRDLYIPDTHGNVFDFFEVDFPRTNRQLVVVTNPPYSKKLEAFERLYAENVPFFCLLPTAILHYKKISALFKKRGVYVLPIVGSPTKFIHGDKEVSPGYCSWFIGGPGIYPGINLDYDGMHGPWFPEAGNEGGNEGGATEDGTEVVAAEDGNEEDAGNAACDDEEADNEAGYESGNEAATDAEAGNEVSKVGDYDAKKIRIDVMDVADMMDLMAVGDRTGEIGASN